jgi:chromosome segregation ATPase
MTPTTQRTRRKSTGKEKVSAGPGGLAAKVKDAASKMAEIRKEEETQLVTLLKEIEAITRDTMNIENEIRTQNLLKGTFEAERRTLQKELEALTRQNNLDDKKRNELEKEHEKLLGKNTQLKSQLGSLEGDLARLQKENSALSLEVEKLQSTNQRLRADVERLTALREEYLKSIAEFKETRDQLLP